MVGVGAADRAGVPGQASRFLLVREAVPEGQAPGAVVGFVNFRFTLQGEIYVRHVIAFFIAGCFHTWNRGRDHWPGCARQDEMTGKPALFVYGLHVAPALQVAAAFFCRGPAKLAHMHALRSTRAWARASTKLAVL